MSEETTLADQIRDLSNRIDKLVRENERLRAYIVKRAGEHEALEREFIELQIELENART